MKKLLYIWLFLFPFFLSGQQYRVGDMIANDDGSKGVVFWVHPDGSGGWMCALNLIRAPWGPEEDIPGLPNIEDRLLASLDTAGYFNTKKIRDYLGPGNTYAAQKVDFDNGWYIPALGQLTKLQAAYPFIEDIISAYGGESLESSTMWIYNSSTEIDSLLVYGCVYGFSTFIQISLKQNALKREKVIPVRSFGGKKILVDTTLSYEWSTGKTTPIITDQPSLTTDYSVTVTTGVGCTASASQRVFVGNGPIVLNEMICEGEEYTHYGFSASTEGIYNHVISGDVPGCDIAATLHLVVSKPDTNHISADIFAGHVYSENNFTVWDEGDHYQYWQNSEGCDSIVILHLKVIPNIITEIHDTVCYRESYLKHGFRVYAAEYSDVYSRYLEAADGNDSIVVLYLTVNPVFRKNFFVNACVGSSYTDHNGFEIEKIQGDTSLHLVYPGALGCDSVLNLYITALKSDESDYMASICKGETYIGHGYHIEAATKDTVFCDTLQNRQGCDSIVRLHLTVHAVNDTILYDTVCSGDPYYLHGFNIPKVTSDRYDTTYVNQYNCDSLVTLLLDTLPTYLWEFSENMCRGESYNFNGTLLDIPGIYHDTLHTQAGCDSILRLTLTASNPYVNKIPATICEGEVYDQYGFNESISGLYSQNFTTIHGCDSILELHLTVEPAISGSVQADLEACDVHEYFFYPDLKVPDSVTVLSYQWNFPDQTLYKEECIYSFPDTGDCIVTLVVESANQCYWEFAYPVYIPHYNEDFDILHTPEYIYSDNPVITFEVDLPENMTYTWELGDGTIGYTNPITHTYQPNSFTEYYYITLTANNSEDCPVVKNTVIQVFHVVEPPNTFSPNGDGINDYFMRGYKVKIVNRNGVAIFSGEEGWDGSYNGKQAPEDTYFYELEYFSPQGTRTKKGYITLIR